MIARLICKTIQSIFLFKTLKTLRERLAIVRKIVNHYRKFLKSRIKSQNRNRKFKSKPKIELRNRQSLEKSIIENRKKNQSQSAIRLLLPEGNYVFHTQKTLRLIDIVVFSKINIENEPKSLFLAIFSILQYAIFSDI